MSPFLVGSTFLIVLYWQLALSRAKMHISGLPKSKWFRVFVFVLIFLLIVMEVTVSTLRSKDTAGIFYIYVLMTVAIYVIILASLSIWYIVTAIRILTLTKKMSIDTAHVRRLNRLIVFTITGAVVWIIGYGLAATRLYSHYQMFPGM
jgi:hypothetical protein